MFFFALPEFGVRSFAPLNSDLFISVTPPALSVLLGQMPRFQSSDLGSLVTRKPHLDKLDCTETIDFNAFDDIMTMNNRIQLETDGTYFRISKSNVQSISKLHLLV